MTSVSFGTIERYSARTLPIVCDIYYEQMVGSELIFFCNDQNFISDSVSAKYLISNSLFPEHYINELPYRAILF